MFALLYNILYNKVMEHPFSVRQLSLVEYPLVCAANDLSAEVLPGFPLQWESGRRVFAALLGTDTVLGVTEAIVHEESQTADLASIAVTPGFQRRGVGGALVSHTLTALAAEGVTSVAMVPTSEGSRRLCKQFGFVGKVVKHVDISSDHTLPNRT